MFLLRWLKTKLTDTFINFFLKLSTIAIPKSYLSLLSALVDEILESNGNPQAVYPILQSNLDKLNKQLVVAIYGWANPVLEQGDTETKQILAAILITLGDAVLDFPNGNIADQIEIAIAAYNLAYGFFNSQGDAETTNLLELKLANAYSRRLYGRAQENQSMANILANNVASNLMDAVLPIATDQSLLPEVSDIGFRLLNQILEAMLQGLFTGLMQAANFEPSAVQQVPVSYDLNNSLGDRMQQIVFPLLEENLDQLDEQFAEKIEQISSQDLPIAQAVGSEMLVVLLGGLGELLIKFAKGNLASNIEIAIAIYEKAIRFLPDRDHLEGDLLTLWIGMKSGLARTYTNRVQGDEPGNIEKAISYFQEAINACQRPEHHVEIIQREMASAYRRRIYGDKEENLAKAINCYEQALQIITPEVSRRDWAIIQLNLGNVYSDLHWRNNDDATKQTEAEYYFRRAVQCYEAAVKEFLPNSFPQEWLLIQSNLGGLYSEAGNRSRKNLKQAEGFYQKVLQTVKRREYPYDWALAKYHLGLVYRDQKKYGSASQCFQDALEVFLPSIYPLESLRAGRNLGNVSLVLGQLDVAITGFSAAIGGVEQRRAWTTTESRKQFLLESWVELYVNLIRVYVHTNQYEKALEYVERSKARNLVELLHERTQYPKGVTEEICCQLDDLRKQITLEQKRLTNEQQQRLNDLDATTSESSRGALTTYIPDYFELDQLQQNLENFIIQKVQRIDPSFGLTQRVKVLDFQELQALLPDAQTALLEWYIAGDKFFVFAVIQEANAPLVWESTPKDLENLQQWVSAYLKNYNEDRQKWKYELSDYLQQLSTILHLDQVLSLLPSDCRKLILVPHLYLHILPLHALPLQDGSYLIDQFSEGIRYTPSCQLLQLAQARQRPHFQNLFAVQNPTGDLLYSDVEVQVVCSYFSEYSTVVSKQAAKATLLDNQSFESAHCTHFSCHGEFNLQYPLQSSVFLTNEEKLILAEVFNLSLNQCRLVTLSACETGLIDFTSLSDEYIGLPGGFLYAGSPSVVSSLWRVSDISTTLLMIRFYKNLRQLAPLGAGSVAIALNDAQKWLRKLTSEEFEQILLELQPEIEEVFSRMRPGQQLIFQESLNKVRKRQPFPFIHPYYWAGFIATGL